MTAANEPVTFVVERRSGGIESPSIIYGPLPQRLTNKNGKALLVYAYRLDKMPGWAELGTVPSPQTLYQQFCDHRKTNTLPASNLSDPPQKTDGGRKGSLRGEESWWVPPPLPRGSDWTP